jgi:hypothetical protein
VGNKPPVQEPGGVGKPDIGRKIDRRRFLTGLALGAGLAPFASQFGRSVDARKMAASLCFDSGTAAKSVLQTTDLTFLGGFKVPPAVNGQSTRYDNVGLTFRRVGSQARLLGIYPGGVYEMAVPQSLAGSIDSAPVASVVGSYPTIYDPSWGYGEARGIYWDETDGRLYQVMGAYYDPPLPDHRTVYYATLGNNGTLTRYGPWSTVNLPYKMVMGGVTGIPQWFASKYLGGKRIALGFGGAYSTMGQFGPGSAGPALSAIAPPDPSTPQFGSLNDTPLLAHWWNTSEYTRPWRWERSPDVNLKPAGKPSSMWLDGGVWSPKNGVGFWTWVDLFEAAGCWIDTPTKHGMLFAPVLATGDVWYELSDTRYNGLKHIWAMYDPMELVNVATGAKGQDQLKSAWQMDVKYPWNKYPQIPSGQGGGTPYYQVPKGCAFDAVDSRLYIMVSHPEYTPDAAYGFYDDPVVYVYKVS